MVQNNKHKSIRSLKNEMIKKYSPEENKKENLELVDIISENRTKEIHTGEKDINKNAWADQLLFDIQYGYMKELYINQIK